MVWHELHTTDLAGALAFAAEVAGRHAANGEPLPLLHGLPLGVKDLLDTQGLLSTCGNIGLRGHVPSVDHPWVARLRLAPWLPSWLPLVARWSVRWPAGYATPHCPLARCASVDSAPGNWTG